MIDFSTAGISISSPYRPPVVDTSSKASGNETLNPEKNNHFDTLKNELSIKKTDENKTAEELSLDEIQELSKLKQRDREVRLHEQAHISAGGQYVRGGAHYDYQKGPDGKNYAIGGEVQIDTSKIPGDPEATARKMQVIRRAAMAPASPSGQDRSVASRATRIENQMRTEILMRRYEESVSFETGRAEKKPSMFDKISNQRDATGTSLNVVI